MPATAEGNKSNKTPKTTTQLSPAFLAAAQRLPVQEGKIVLDRNNKDHVRWAEEDSGKWFIDCAECMRGGNGVKSCSAGWHIKKTNHGGCFIGELLPKYKESKCENK